MTASSEALQAMLAEATRTARYREDNMEAILKDQDEQGRSKTQLADYRKQLEHRCQLMKDIVDMLQTAVHAAREMGDDSEWVSYQGEVMLANWSDTAAAGRQVVFWLEEGADADTEHPFKQYTRRLRGHAGTRFQAVLVEIDDEGQPVPRGTMEEQHPRATPRLKGGAISKNAGILCKDADFQRYLSEIAKVAAEDERVTVDETIAAEYMRTMCEIESRADLDHNRNAQLAYENKVVSPFYRWLEFNEGGHSA
jgi:hypothetical protein